MPIPFEFDFKNPDYHSVFLWRAERLDKIRKDPSCLPYLFAYYKNNPAQFIIDWGMTYDPRNADIGLPSMIPFLLFPKQEEWIHWIMDHWRNRMPGITEKTRDMGMSWLSVGFATTICLFHSGVSIGFGSRKEEYVDIIGGYKSLLEKSRIFISLLPPEFRRSWNRSRDGLHMRIRFPETGSIITGETGDGIGRGDRCSIYFVDESAFLERPELSDASLSQTTNCRQDISTPNGLGNSFAARRFSGKIDVFTFHWKDDPRKSDDWYKKQVELLDPIVVAQEINIDYAASVEGIIIPMEWIRSAIDSHIKLGLEVTGDKLLSLDPQDEGRDKNAITARHGFLINYCHQFSGKSSDLFETTLIAMNTAEELKIDKLVYDADGLGAACRGDSEKINEERREAGLKSIKCFAYRGSGAVLQPNKTYLIDAGGKKIKNKEYFQNFKAQAWFHLREMFKETHAAVNGKKYDESMIISIDSKMKLKDALISELSQPTYKKSATGKIMVDKKPNGTPSPNLADSVVQLFAPKKQKLDLSEDWE